MTPTIYFYLALLLSSPQELNSVQCGVKPVPPVGCKIQSAVCACDADNNCEWMFTDC